MLLLDDNTPAIIAAAAQADPSQAVVPEGIKAVGEAGGYVYIMDTASGVPFISSTLSKDVTADVKAKLGLR